MRVDLFAGIDGWSLGASAVHFEIDRDACATLAALGVPTVRADVSAWPLGHMPEVEGIVASPPCQMFSVAGSKKGIQERDLIVEHVHTCVDGWRPWTESHDPRTSLVLEPLRWTLTLRPRWLACEQVPAVLPIWDAVAEVLRAHGYSSWSGVLNAADYGVPQTRRRAILMASLDRPVVPPVATHAQDPQPGLLGTPRPWVTMAQALGWDGRVGFPRRDDRGCPGAYRERDWRDTARPAQTVTTKARSWRRVVVNTGRGWKPGWTRATAQIIDADRPAPTFTGCSGSQWQIAPAWTRQQPATTVVASYEPDVTAPEWQHTGDKPRQDTPGSVKVTVEEALILQGFPPDWPVRGNRTAQFRQIGNAIPRALGQAIVAALGGS